MHILLTDVLTCPRCGPEFGLIVLADRIENRRVWEGRLGCANCREEYPVSAGVADLRFPPGTSLPNEEIDRGEEWPMRTAALLGLSEGPGVVLVVGPGAEWAGEIASLVPHVLVIGAVPDFTEGRESSGESRVRVGQTLPFRSHSLRGVALTGSYADPLLDESIRALARDGRLIVDPASPGTAEDLRERGLAILLDEAGVVVASSAGAA
jgi:uncharacterized protein YbaR (Trm112 family)